MEFSFRSSLLILLGLLFWGAYRIDSYIQKRAVERNRTYRCARCGNHMVAFENQEVFFQRSELTGYRASVCNPCGRKIRIQRRILYGILGGLLVISTAWVYAD